MEIFEKLHEQGNTIILVTHEPDIAEHAHRIVRLRDGLVETDIRNEKIMMTADAENQVDTIYRSKAVGEPPFMLGISAFLALADAVAACGPNWADLQAPPTSEEVLAAIGRARG